MTRREAIAEMNDSLTKEDLITTLDFYGIARKGNEILCPFHGDRHFGSCSIIKNTPIAKCFSCGKSFSPVTLVMHYEGLRYNDAFCFLWEKVLGRTLPEFDKESRKREYFTSEELRSIGILAPSPTRLRRVIGITLSGSDIPGADPSVPAADGWTAVTQKEPVMSLLSIWDKDQETALMIIQSKATASIRELNERKEALVTKGSPEWNLYHVSEEAMRIRISAYDKAILKAENVLAKARKLQKSKQRRKSA